MHRYAGKVTVSSSSSSAAPAVGAPCAGASWLEDDAQEKRQPLIDAGIILAGIAVALLPHLLPALLPSAAGARAGWVLARTVVTGLLCIALLWRRQHWPWLVPTVLVANALVSSPVVMVVGTYAYASRCGRRWAVLLVTLLAALTGSVRIAMQPTTPVDAWVHLTFLLMVGMSAAAGMYVLARRQLLAQLRERARVAEQGRAAAEEEARRAERTRIAREMHDIVAHRISLISLQAGALEVNPDLSREQVVEAAALIRTTSRQALEELRGVLGVLRGSDEQAPLEPQPTWADVRRLVRSTQESGVDLDFFDFVEGEVPDALARTAYRVAQEALTNIHKHARHTRARVALIGQEGSDLILEISNPMPADAVSDLPGARMGLSGLEARVAHAGGRLTSGPTEDGRFHVKAVIPWPPQT